MKNLKNKINEYLQPMHISFDASSNAKLTLPELQVKIQSKTVYYIQRKVLPIWRDINDEFKK